MPFPRSFPVATIATAQLFGTSLWFSANSAAPDLMQTVNVAVQLSRPAAYARLDRLRSLLGADLGHARTRLSLHLALLALDGGTT